MAEIISTYTNSEGHTINVYKSGAEYDMTAGHIIKAPPQYAITKERSAEFAEQRKQKGIRSHMRGMIKGAGLKIEEDASDEALVNGSADALEVYIAKLGQTFMKSENIRGMGEVTPKLLAPFMGDDKTAVTATPTLIQNNLNVSAGEALKFIQDVIAKQKELQAAETVDAEATDAPQWLHGEK